MNRYQSAILCGLSLLIFVMPAIGIADPLDDLRTELNALKTSSQQRIQELEQRLTLLEAPATATASAPTPAARAAPLNSATAFNPAMSLILAGSYAHLSADPSRYQLAGFIPTDEAGPGARGFSLGESELTMSANIDPYFAGNLTAAISGDNGISVEEAFFRTTSLSHGLTLKGGRFFSGLGYLNSVHAHAWDFVDQPLAYQALLDEQYTQNGVQLKWLAPTDMLLEFGLEGGSGAHFPGTVRSANGLNASAAFVHAGSDVGDSASWRAGLSLLRTDAEARSYESVDAAGVPVTNAFTGSSRTWVADLIWKWAPHGNSTQHQLKLQGEYLRRSESGGLNFDTELRSLPASYRSQQSGWYLQGVYQFRPRWRAGLRFDSLDPGQPQIGIIPGGLQNSFAFPELQPAASPRRTSLMLDWNLSEFSRLRGQYGWDDSRAGVSDRQLFLQYLFSLGAHGAHTF